MLNVSGLTIIEIIVAVAILSMIAGFAFWISFDFYKTYNFDAEFNILTSVLRKARNLAMTNYNESAHGVYLEPNRYTLFQGATYTSRNSNFDQIFLPTNVGFSGINEIVFSQLSGDASASGTIIMNYEIKNKIISINYEGKIE